MSQLPIHEFRARRMESQAILGAVMWGKATGKVESSCGRCGDQGRVVRGSTFQQTTNRTSMHR
eukprot:5539314-Alexandrium_andersonii.AAC.1